MYAWTVCRRLVSPGLCTKTIIAGFSRRTFYITSCLLGRRMSFGPSRSFHDRRGVIRCCRQFNVQPRTNVLLDYLVCTNTHASISYHLYIKYSLKKYSYIDYDFEIFFGCARIIGETPSQSFPWRTVPDMVQVHRQCSVSTIL